MYHPIHTLLASLKALAVQAWPRPGSALAPPGASASTSTQKLLQNVKDTSCDAKSDFQFQFEIYITLHHVITYLVSYIDVWSDSDCFDEDLPGPWNCSAEGLGLPPAMALSSFWSHFSWALGSEERCGEDVWLQLPLLAFRKSFPCISASLNTIQSTFTTLTQKRIQLNH